MMISRIFPIRILILTCALHSWTSESSDAQFDVHWDDQLAGPPGVDGSVLSLEYREGELYVGGEFITLDGGNVVATNIAKWTGEVWAALGSGVDGAVRAIAATDSAVFVGGSFTHAGGVKVNGIARWDGSEWSALGNGVNGEVYAIGVEGDRLYVGGSFTEAGGVTANRVALWDGTNWAALGDGFNDVVRAIELAGDQLYVGGNFTSAGAVEANRIAKWDGSSWAPVGDGIPWTSGQIYTIEASGTNLYAGGFFTSAGASGPRKIARWDGLAWTSVGYPSALNNSVHKIIVIGDALYAAGWFNYVSQGPFLPGETINSVAKYVDGRWSWLGPNQFINGVSGPAECMATDGERIWVGGIFESASGVVANRLAAWDGTGWTALGDAPDQGSNGKVRAMVWKGDDLYIGGSFTRVNGVSAANLAKCSDGIWSQVGGGIQGQGGDTGVHALAVLDDDLFVGGGFVRAGSMNVTNIVRWDGTNWHGLGSGIVESVWRPPALPWVFTLGVWGTALYVGGDFTAAGGVPAKNIARWDGTNWFALGSGTSSEVRALAVLGDELIVGGGFSQAGGMQAHHVARWTGVTWLTCGSLDNTVNALCVDGTNLYAGGFFGGSPPSYPSRIAIWDGTAWQPLGNAVSNGVNGAVSSMLCNAQGLFVGGAFTSAGEIRAPGIAKWDGAGWVSLGSGIFGTVNCLTMNDADLHAGGSFVRAGAHGSYNLARWNETLLFGLPRLAISLSGDAAIVSWPGWATNFVLETSTPLNGSTWEPVGMPGVTVYTNSPASGDLFFRLKQP
jgi:trimeric autotransporter adhesin